MGFTDYEKTEFLATLRDSDKIETLRVNNLPDEVLAFLNSEGLTRQIRDYGIISKVMKIGRPESITITYLLDSDTKIHDILLNWQEFLSPPVSSYFLINNFSKNNKV